MIDRLKNITFCQILIIIATVGILIIGCVCIYGIFAPFDYSVFNNGVDEKTKENCQLCLQQYAPNMILEDSVPYYYYLAITSFEDDPPMIVMKYRILNTCDVNCTNMEEI